MRADVAHMIEKLDASSNELNELSKTLTQTIDRGNRPGFAQLELLDGTNTRMQEAFSEMRVYAAWLASSETEDELPDETDLGALKESQDRFIAAVRLIDDVTQRVKRALGMIP